jgi:hypothetical protein
MDDDDSTKGQGDVDEPQGEHYHRGPTYADQVAQDTQPPEGSARDKSPV